MKTTTPETGSEHRSVSIVAASVALAVYVGTLGLVQLPGQWLEWLLRYWGMA